MLFVIKKRIVFLRDFFFHILLGFGYLFNFPFLSALAIKLSFFKSKKIQYKKKYKKSLIISYRTGGVDDIYQVFKNYPPSKKILFLDRKYLRKIFNHFHKDIRLKYEKEFYFKKDYRIFMKKLVSWLNILEKNFSFLTFNFNYFEDVVFREYAYKNGNSCYMHFKESFRTRAEFKIHNDKSLNRYISFFSKISVYNNDTKQHFAKRWKNISKRISVVGMPRAIFSHNIKKNSKQTKTTNILFYYFKKYKGMPTRYNRFNYFADSGIPKHKPLSWQPIINEIFDTMIKLAKIYPNINFYIKAKKGEDENFKYIKKIENLDLPNLKYFNDGPGHFFLENSQIVIGMNSAAILEAIIAGRKVIIPFFSKFRKKVYNQYTFDLPKNLMVKNKLHLENILKENIDKGNINLPFKNKNYKQISKKYFGDFQNSEKNLRKFLDC